MELFNKRFKVLVNGVEKTDHVYVLETAALTACLQDALGELNEAMEADNCTLDFKKETSDKIMIRLGKEPSTQTMRFLLAWLGKYPMKKKVVSTYEVVST